MNRQRLYWCFFSCSLPSSTHLHTHTNNSQITNNIYIGIRCQHLLTINSCNYFVCVGTEFATLLQLIISIRLAIAGWFNAFIWCFLGLSIYCMRTANYRNIFVSMITEGRFFMKVVSTLLGVINSNNNIHYIHYIVHIRQRHSCSRAASALSNA